MNTLLFYLSISPTIKSLACMPPPLPTAQVCFCLIKVLDVRASSISLRTPLHDSRIKFTSKISPIKCFFQRFCSSMAKFVGNILVVNTLANWHD